MIRYIKNNFLKNLGYALVGVLIIGGWLAVVSICIYINTILSYYEKEGKYKD